jgi:hypothetical protein
VNTARKPQPDTKRDDLDLLPRKEGMKRADDLLRALLNSPPGTHKRPDLRQGNQQSRR